MMAGTGMADATVVPGFWFSRDDCATEIDRLNDRAITLAAASEEKHLPSPERYRLRREFAVTIWILRSRQRCYLSNTSRKSANLKKGGVSTREI